MTGYEIMVVGTVTANYTVEAESLEEAVAEVRSWHSYGWDTSQVDVERILVEDAFRPSNFIEL